MKKQSHNPIKNEYNIDIVITLGIEVTSWRF